MQKRSRYFLGLIVLVILIILILIIKSFFSHSSPISSRKNIPQIGIPSLSLSIGSNGDMRIFGLVFDSINSGTINSTSSIQDIPVSFIIKTDGNTSVHMPGNATSSISSLMKGDILMIAGTLQDFGHTVIVAAKDIRVIGGYSPGQAAASVPLNSVQNVGVSTSASSSAKVNKTVKPTTSTKKTVKR